MIVLSVEVVLPPIYSIDNYMLKYNSRRLHSAIGNKTPNEVYDTAISNLKFRNQELLEVA